MYSFSRHLYPKQLKSKDERSISIHQRVAVPKWQVWYYHTSCFQEVWGKVFDRYEEEKSMSPTGGL